MHWGRAGGRLAHRPHLATVLAEQWSDHGLIADDEWDAGDRDIHLGGDFLLICRIDPHPDDRNMQIVIFKRLGTDSDLFG